MDQNDTIDTPAEDADSMTATADEPSAGSGAGGVMPAFLAELARAMQAAAERERERIAEVVAGEAAEHVEKARTRAAAETEELRRRAEEDLERIQVWSTTEIERVRREAERRTDERRNGLEAYLAQHDTIIATEIDGVDSAVRDYRVTLDQFFGELMGSTDPADIARRAGSLPAVPDLEGVRAAARAAAVSQLANAPQDAGVGPLVDEHQWSVQASVGVSADADVSHEPAAGAEAGMGVMDPDATGQSEELTSALGEVEPEVAAESETAPRTDALRVPADDAAEAATETDDHSSSAVRLLRSIAPWTSPGDHTTHERDSHTH